MSRSHDFQIGWVVIFALIFWLGIWQHESVARVWHIASTAVIGMTSSLLGSGQRPADPTATPERPTRSPRSAPSK